MKKHIALLLCVCICCTMLTACSPSPTAIKVGGRKVDASEYAFYLNYNRLGMTQSGVDGGTAVYDEAALQACRDAALDQITTNEVVRLKCKEYDLTLSEELEKELKANKEELIDTLGGKAAYLDYLNQSALTDRCYDKFQESSLYYDLLYDYILDRDSATLYTDEALRQYFAEHYITVKYVRISLLDENGAAIDAENAAAKKIIANSVFKRAQAENADFDALIAEYNDDMIMTSSPEGLVISRLEATSTDYLLPAFDLSNGEIGGIYESDDGYYILQRLPVSAEYFGANREYILQSAGDWHFTQLLNEWKAAVKVSTAKVVNKIDFTNYMEYVK